MILGFISTWVASRVATPVHHTCPNKLMASPTRRDRQPSPRSMRWYMLSTTPSSQPLDPHSFICVVLGDLHLDPSNMQEHLVARDTHIKNALDTLEEQERAKLNKQDLKITRHAVSLGDLGAYGIAGLSTSFELARDYLRGFATSPVEGRASYSVLTGNHDLEGFQEFQTDRDNLLAWAKCFAETMVMSPSVNELPVFRFELNHETVLLGLSTTRFRDSPASSHEVFIDDEQVSWFERELAELQSQNKHVLVFSHAPPMGSNLRSLNTVHVKNQCAWLNHASGRRRRQVFLKLVKKYTCIKAWFSGHFHLSHDFEDSISMVNDSCTFVQCGVIGSDSARDHRRQTRIIAGNEQEFKIYSVNHHNDGELRLDATIHIDTETKESIKFEPHPPENYGMADWFRAYTPREDDGCYLDYSELETSSDVAPAAAKVKKVCFWHMKDGRVLGVHDSMIIEYDSETLSPVGIVMTKEELNDRDVFLIPEVNALVIYPPRDGLDVEVVHPNPDGSYARQYQLNKRVRIERKSKEKLAKKWMESHAVEMGRLEEGGSREPPPFAPAPAPAPAPTSTSAPAPSSMK